MAAVWPVQLRGCCSCASGPSLSLLVLAYLLLAIILHVRA